VLVRYDGSASGARKSSVRTLIHASRVRALRVPGMEVLTLKRGTSVEATVRKLGRSGGVAYAEPNWYRFAASVPNDSVFGRQWGLNNTAQLLRGVKGVRDADIDAPEAWNMTTGSRAVIVGVIDSGLLYDHPDLAENVWSNPGETGGGKETNGADDDGDGYVDDVHGWDFLDNDSDPYDEWDMHGSHVAGTIGAVGNNARGVTGVSQQVSLMPVRAIGEGFGSDNVSTVADIVDAIVFARTHGARVINASYGGYGYSKAEFEAIRASPNVLFVAAAGNDGVDLDFESSLDDEDEFFGTAARPRLDDLDDILESFIFGRKSLTYPCGYPIDQIVCVAATDARDNLAPFSNTGATSVDLGAPGVNVFSTWRSDPRFRDRFRTTLSNNWVQGGRSPDWQRSSLFGEQFLTYGPFEASLGTAKIPNHTDAWLQIKNPLDFTGKTGCTLSLQAGQILESDYDTLNIEASTDGANWVALPDAITGVGGETMHYDLKDYSGVPGMRLRLHLSTDKDTQSLFLVVDDVVVWCRPANFQRSPYTYESGTSMATPHVSGTAALILSQFPLASPAFVKHALLAGGDRNAKLEAATVSGRRLNARGALNVAHRNGGPLGFDLATPGNGKFRTSRAPTLSWHPSGAAAGIDRYQLYIDGRLHATTAGTVTSAHPAFHLAYGVHHWYVRAYGTNGRSIDSTTHSLFIKVRPTVTLLRRSGNATSACGTLAAKCKVAAGGRISFLGHVHATASGGSALAGPRRVTVTLVQADSGGFGRGKRIAITVPVRSGGLYTGSLRAPSTRHSLWTLQASVRATSRTTVSASRRRFFFLR
jgi:subtilisin family serine protease